MQKERKGVGKSTYWTWLATVTSEAKTDIKPTTFLVKTMRSWRQMHHLVIKIKTLTVTILRFNESGHSFRPRGNTLLP